MTDSSVCHEFKISVIKGVAQGTRKAHEFQTWPRASLSQKLRSLRQSPLTARSLREQDWLKQGGLSAKKVCGGWPAKADVESYSAFTATFGIGD